MRIERYYSSTREEVTDLSKDAAQLLTDEDYVGFFKACGPNYVRGIRRAQEVMAMFQFQSTSRESARQFATSMKASYWLTSGAASFTGKSKHKSASSSLQITIKGYGMGLSQEGSETLVASSLQEYNSVMKFAFKSMTQLEDSYNVGMVYGIEIVPWVHNVAFQVAAKLQDADILIPMPRNLIPKAYPTDKTRRTGNNVLAFSNTDSVRGQFSCKGFNFAIDKFGYCCEPEHMYDLANSTYREFGKQTKDDVCRPIQSLDKSLIKDNMSNNGEFVARLGSALRSRFTAMAVLEKCISASNSIPDKFLDNVLKDQDTVYYPNTIKTKVTLRHMKLAIDPKGDYSFLKHVGNELDEWIEMFYSPCMAALFGTNVGSTPDVEANYFMAYPWYHHTECMYLTCLTSNMRWDRKSGGCQPGVLNGIKAVNYTDAAGDDAKCSKDEDENDGDAEVCKHTQASLKTSQEGFLTCWKDHPIGSVSYFITYYCMPQVTAETTVAASGTAQETARLAYKATYDTCRTGVQSTTSRRRLASAETLTLQSGGSGDTSIMNDSNEDFVADLKMRIEKSRYTK